MSVGGARNTVETVGGLDGHYDGAIGAAGAVGVADVRWGLLGWNHIY